MIVWIIILFGHNLILVLRQTTLPFVSKYNRTFRIVLLLFAAAMLATSYHNSVMYQVSNLSF